jgi:hypothetical protein
MALLSLMLLFVPVPLSPAFKTHTADVYASDDFVAKGKEAEPFLSSLKPILGGRNTSFGTLAFPLSVIEPQG